MARRRGIAAFWQTSGPAFSADLRPGAVRAPQTRRDDSAATPPADPTPASSRACAASTATAGCCSRCGRCGCSAYGFLAVVLVLYLDALGLDPLAIGIVLTLTLVGDTLISLWLTTHADRLGRRRVLIAGALLMVVAGLVFALDELACRCSSSPATIGVISPTGNEVGPFLAVEQAALTQTVPDAAPDGDVRLVQPRRATSRPRPGRSAPGSLSQALLDGGLAPRRRLPRDRHRLRGRSGSRWPSGSGGSAPAVEAPPAHGRRRRHPAPARARPVARASSLRLSALFSLDAFGGGFIPQSLMAYWFHLQFGVEPAVLGAIFFGGEPAGRGLVAVGGADRGADRPDQHDGLHPPAVERAADPRPADADPAAGGRRSCSLRFSLSQMDVPTRQSYVMAVVDPDERSAAAGVTGDRPDDRRGDLAVDLARADRERRATRRCRSTSPAA